MKITKTFVSVFLVTFFIGYVSVLPTKKTPSSIEPSILAQEKISLPHTASIDEEDTDEEYNENWKEDICARFKIKLLEAGEFHGDEVTAKTGETWLGLFKQGDEFFLVSSKIKVKRVYDPVVDEKPSQKTGKGVSAFVKKSRFSCSKMRAS